MNKVHGFYGDMHYLLVVRFEWLRVQEYEIHVQYYDDDRDREVSEDEWKSVWLPQVTGWIDVASLIIVFPSLNSDYIVCGQCVCVWVCSVSLCWRKGTIESIGSPWFWYLVSHVHMCWPVYTCCTSCTCIATPDMVQWVVCSCLLFVRKATQSWESTQSLAL